MSAWGDEKTKFFFELTPERVLEAVEASGLRCTGRCAALNSFENRVYEVELELSDDEMDRLEAEHGSREGAIRAARIASRRVAKFYRPGRWSREQILDEHAFVADLNAGEVPAVAPLAFADGQTLHKMPGADHWYCLFPKVGGRSPDELTGEQLRRIGRLLARVHTIGASRPAKHRLEIGPESYGLANLEFLLKGNLIPLEFAARFRAAVESVCATTKPWFDAAPKHRLHGDCHLGNLLWSDAGPFFVDFDDMVIGPAVQDLWLLIPGRVSEEGERIEALLEGYEEMRAFDRSTLRLIEPLRALRFVHYSAWIARRWEDPAFSQAFPHFGSHRYWNDLTLDLEHQNNLILAASSV